MKQIFYPGQIDFHLQSALKEGKMIIFPSHLEHSVNENLSDQDRISVSFNLIIDNN